MNISKTIYNQINALDRFAFAAWGSKDFVHTKKGLQFRVGGMAKFKGWVHIKHNAGKDSYDIDFSKNVRGLPQVVETIEDVFAENLVSTIDLAIQ